ncbi:MAG: DCL family protein [Pseudomonadota bacterium]
MSKPIIFGNYQFKTKKSATEEIRHRINKYETGDKLNAVDELFFESLFMLHTEYSKKIGVGIDHIEVERDFHNNRCLFIHRVDGTKIDCSWVHCVKPASIKTVISVAFRRAVKERIMAFKELQLSSFIKCPILGVALNYKNSHVSYSEPCFDVLLSEFFVLNNLTFETIELINPEPSDLDQRGKLKELAIKEKWVVYHENNSTLELLSAKANLSKRR